MRPLRFGDIIPHALLAAAFLTIPAKASVDAMLYNQPATFPGGIASQNAPNAFGPQYTAFDDFALATDASITSIQWQGAYSSSPVQGITQFQLMFLADNAGLPGGVLQTYAIPGNAGETLVGTSSGFFDFSYLVNLPTPFDANANTKYWLSIQPTVDFPPQWFWRAGTGGDGQSAQINLSVSSKPFLVPEDSAFSLTGTAVPEPSTLELTSIGMSMIGLSAWRRARRRSAEACRKTLRR